MGLIRFIIIIAIAYYSFKFIGRILAPFALKYFVNKLNQNPDNQHVEQKPEGEVTIEYIPEKNSKLSQDIGEYTDYDEIK